MSISGQVRSRNPTTSDKIIKISTHKQFKKNTQHQVSSDRHDAAPVKDIEILNEIKSYILSKGRYGHRNWLIFTVGINSGRRCGDILHLTIGDVYDTSIQSVKNSVYKVEQKTGKKLEYFFPEVIRTAISDYISNIGIYSLDDPLFRSQKGSFLLTSSYWKILSDIKKDLELNFRFSTHTMRKTFGYHKYQALKNVDIPGGFSPLAILSKIYGHSSEAVTAGYVGITEDVKINLYQTNVL